MDAADLPTLNLCVAKLMDKLTAKEYELAQREASLGPVYDMRKTAKLRADIASLTIRLERAERLQVAALTARE